jgi:hypothetical protein
MGDDDAPDRLSVANLEGTRLLHADRAQVAQRASAALSQRIEVWRPRTTHNADRTLRRAQIERTAYPYTTKAEAQPRDRGALATARDKPNGERDRTTWCD